MPDLPRRPPIGHPALRGQVTIQAAPVRSRLVLRCRGDVIAVNAALGVELPLAICRANADGNVQALKLGPDEWLILAPDGEALGARLEQALAAISHSVVDVGHRQTAIIVAGPRGSDVLNAGCPLDLSLEAFPVGMATRTVLGKTEIVLWRSAADSFHLEVARSFAPYLWDFLAEAAREFLE